jgi:hypothetical protein
MKTITVNWIDATLYDATTSFSLEEVKELELCTLETTGFLVYENELFIAVARDHSLTTRLPFRGLSLIPKCCIVKTTRHH